MPTPNLATITSTTPLILTSAQMASGSTTIYTVGANKAAKVSSFVLCNTGVASVTVSVALVQSGGTADGTHRVMSGYAMGAGESTKLVELEGSWMGTGDFLSVTVSAGSAVDVVATGLEFA